MRIITVLYNLMPKERTDRECTLYAGALIITNPYIFYTILSSSASVST